jgi:hypothetical protein
MSNGNKKSLNEMLSTASRTTTQMGSPAPGHCQHEEEVVEVSAAAGLACAGPASSSATPEGGISTSPSSPQPSSTKRRQILPAGRGPVVSRIAMPATSSTATSATNKNRRQLPISRKLPNRFRIGTANINSSMTEEEEHRAMTAAIFDIGIDESSPVSIFENMSTHIKQKHSALNLEKIKSKLQKYRKSKAKNKADFMGVYDSTFDEILSAIPVKKRRINDSSDGNDDAAVAKHDNSTSSTEPEGSTGDSAVSTPANSNQLEQQHNKGAENVLQVMPPSVVASLSSGEIAAYLAHQAMITSEDPHTRFQQQESTSVRILADENDSAMPVASIRPPSSSLMIAPNGSNVTSSSGGEIIGDPSSILELPALSHAELESPLGHAFQNFLGLYSSVVGSLQQSRALSDRLCTSVSQDETLLPTTRNSAARPVAEHHEMPPPETVRTIRAHSLSAENFDLVGQSLLRSLSSYPEEPAAVAARLLAGMTSSAGVHNFDPTHVSTTDLEFKETSAPYHVGAGGGVSPSPDHEIVNPFLKTSNYIESKETNNEGSSKEK